MTVVSETGACCRRKQEYDREYLITYVRGNVREMIQFIPLLLLFSSNGPRSIKLQFLLQQLLDLVVCAGTEQYKSLFLVTATADLSYIYWSFRSPVVETIFHTIIYGSTSDKYKTVQVHLYINVVLCLVQLSSRNNENNHMIYACTWTLVRHCYSVLNCVNPYCSTVITRFSHCTHVQLMY